MALLKRFEKMMAPDIGAGNGGANGSDSESENKNYDTSGLDMGPTIDFYQKNLAAIIERLPAPIDQESDFLLENKELIGLSEEEIAAAINLFPKNAQSRSVLSAIKGVPKAWFKKGEQAPTPTEDAGQAISRTAIIPSFHATQKWPKTEIHLYDIDESACSPQVRKIILTQGLIHEFAHSIITPDLYLADRKIKLPSGQEVSAFDYIVNEFGNAVDGKYGPISHYASAYRDNEKRFAGNVLVAINEELAESITAHLLKFVYSRDNQKREFDPFKGREEVEEIVKNYLQAQAV